MIRLRNTQTGAVVSCTAETAELLGAGWVDAGGKTAPVAEGYAALSVPALHDEITRRNEGRDEADLIPAKGRKADLVAALEADDELADEADDEQEGDTGE